MTETTSLSRVQASDTTITMGKETRFDPRRAVAERYDRVNAKPSKAQTKETAIKAIEGTSLSRPGMSAEVSSRLLEAAVRNPALADSLAISRNLNPGADLAKMGPPASHTGAPGTTDRLTYGEALQQDTKGSDWQRVASAMATGSASRITSPYGGADALPPGEGSQYEIVTGGQTTPPMDGQGNQILPPPLEEEERGISKKHIFMGIGAIAVVGGMLFFASRAKKKGR